MQCPRCGNIIGTEASFCPGCGSRLEPEAYESAGWEEPPAARRKHRVAIAALLTVAVVAVAAMFAVIGQDEDQGDGAYYQSLKDDVIVTGDVFSDGTFTAELGENNTLVVTLNDDYEGFRIYTWDLTDVSGSSSSVTKYDPYVTIYLDNVKSGEYTVSVTYSTGYGFNTSRVTVGGELLLTRDITESYEWSYDDMTFTASVTYTYDAYRAYAEDGAARSATDTSGYHLMADLIDVDPTVTALEASLREQYLSAYGSDAATDGQAYADFILAFVQICFDYEYDSDMYRAEEYWAYPMETIYHEGGDCEDTAILCAALYTAAGYDAGIFVIPGHAIAAVSLDGYEAPTLGPMQSRSYAVFSYTYDGQTYYGGETTLDGSCMQVGLISSAYSMAADGTVYYMNQAYTEGYGLYLAE